MDINDVRAVVTALSFLAFIGIVWWAYSSRRKQTYDEAARMPLDDDDKPVHAPRGTGQTKH
jgi:cytochrome c oxidase cbb3-type subunit 4